MPTTLPPCGVNVLSVSDITAAQCPGSFVVDVLRFRVYIRLGKAQPITTAVPPPKSKFSKGPTWPLERKYKFLFCSLGRLPSLEHERLQPRGRWRDDDKCRIERAAGDWCGSCGSSYVGADGVDSLIGSHHQKVTLYRKEHMVNYFPFRARHVSASNANELGRSRA